MTPDQTMDLASVASYLGAKAETVAQLARNGELPGAQIGKGWIFLREDVLAFLRMRIAQETDARRAAKAGTHPQDPREAALTELHAVAVAYPRGRTRRTVLPPLPDLPGESITINGTPGHFREDSRSA